MGRRRIPLVLVALVGVAVLVAYYVLLERGLTRAGRRASQDRAGAEASGEHGAEGPADGASGMDPQRLAALIAEHGAFSARGRVLLRGTSVAVPAAGVALRVDLGGVSVEGRAETDAEGSFTLGPLPRLDGYELTVTGARIRTLRRENVAGDREEVDLGDLDVDRFFVVTGRVVGGGNRPLAGARVAALVPALGGSFSFLELARQAGREDEAAAEGETGPGGRFTLELSEPGIFTLRARSEGWAPGQLSEVLVSAVAEPEVTIALRRGEELVGHVLDGVGKPLADASVGLAAQGRGFMAWNREATTTDGAGRFAFRVDAASPGYMLTVVPPRGVSVNRRIELPLAEDLVVRLPGTGVVSGRVIDAETKQPVAGADVLVTLAAGGRAGPGFLPDLVAALTTDSGGAFRVEGVGAVTLQSIAVRASGYAQLTGSAFFASDRALWDRLRATELTGAGGVSLPDVPLARGRVLRGTVTDARTSEPIAGATVVLTDFLLGGRTTATDGRGVYAFDGVGDRVALVVTKPGYAAHRDNPMQAPSLPEDDEVATRDFALEPGGVLAGAVRTIDGSPIAGAVVRVESTEQGGRGGFLQAFGLRDLWAHTDAAGAYRLEGVPPMTARVTAQAAGFDRGTSHDRKVSGGTTVRGVDVVLLAAASAEGVVTGPDGRGVAGARILVTREVEGAGGPGRFRAMMQGVESFADEHGRFEVHDLPVGDLAFRVEADGYAAATQPRAGVKPGERLTGLRLELTPALRIAGRVTDADGEPVAGCFVSAHAPVADGPPGPPVAFARAAEDGSFELKDLAAGNYTLQVRVAGAGRRGPGGFRAQTFPGVAAGVDGLVLTVEASD